MRPAPTIQTIAVSFAGGHAHETFSYVLIRMRSACVRRSQSKAITFRFACGRAHETFSYILFRMRSACVRRPLGGRAHETFTYMLIRMRSACVRRPESKPSHSVSLVGARMKPSVTCCFACILHAFGAHETLSYMLFRMHPACDWRA